MHPYALQMHNELCLFTALLCYHMTSEPGRELPMSSLIHILPHQSNIHVLFNKPCLVCLDLRSQASDGFLITRAMIG